MTSADLGAELSCSICQNDCTEPVSMRCGHNFCRLCIVLALDAQEESGVYSCPECREEYRERPELQYADDLVDDLKCSLCLRLAQENNSHPSNNVQSSPSTQPKYKTFCQVCDSRTLATKTCLLCEFSVCDIHLREFCEISERVLSDPTVSFEDSNYSIQEELMKYYHSERSDIICMSCWKTGEYPGHEVEVFNKDLKSGIEETERRIHSLKDHRREEKEKATGLSERVTGLFRDIREKLDALERGVLSEISRQEEKILLSVSDLISQLEIQKDELSRKLIIIEEFCKITEPIIVTEEPDVFEDWTTDIFRQLSYVMAAVIGPRSCDVINDVRDIGCLNEGIPSQMLHRGLSHFTDSLIDLKIKRPFSVMEKSDILLDIKTASNYIIISMDRRAATSTDVNQMRPDKPERFKCRQVLSTPSFSSGKHYWEVDVSKAERWMIGVAGHSIERKILGNESYIGRNNKSWGLYCVRHLGTIHNNIHKKIDDRNPGSPVQTVGIYLDYEAGRLSFYQLCDPIRHLHTFTATFTEPLHAAFGVYVNTCVKIRK
ncbi:tripartite motif-containing protein 75-like [Mixophyes fleayi]|uniref:tripartite motif-containing protein 75-like n=1 Tax=Mixophyes fleayi TaxID=3061075 RepID=UPI003F4D72BA